jgi:hypothetical protein
MLQGERRDGKKKNGGGGNSWVDILSRFYKIILILRKLNALYQVCPNQDRKLKLEEEIKGLATTEEVSMS